MWGRTVHKQPDINTANVTLPILHPHTPPAVHPYMFFYIVFLLLSFCLFQTFAFSVIETEASKAR